MDESCLLKAAYCRVPPREQTTNRHSVEGNCMQAGQKGTHTTVRGTLEERTGKACHGAINPRDSTAWLQTLTPLHEPRRRQPPNHPQYRRRSPARNLGYQKKNRFFCSVLLGVFFSTGQRTKQNHVVCLLCVPHLPAKRVVVVGGGGAVEDLPVAVLDLHSGLVLHRRHVLRVAVAHLIRQATDKRRRNKPHTQSQPARGDEGANAAKRQGDM